MAHNSNDDYKFWLVVNPATWLIPIFLALLSVSVIIHLVAYNSAKYNIMAAPAAAVVK